MAYYNPKTKQIEDCEVQKHEISSKHIDELMEFIIWGDNKNHKYEYNRKNKSGSGN